MKVSDGCHPGVNIFISSHKSLNSHRETADVGAHEEFNYCGSFLFELK